jgi:hypothetical protein
VIAWSILAALFALAVLAGALRTRAVLPAISAAASLTAALLAPPLLAVASALISVALLALGRLAWRLLDDDSG